MRSSLLVACGSVALAVTALMACAASEDPAQPEPIPTPPVVDGAVPAPDSDAGKPDASDASVEGSACSNAGWCTTVLPDVDLLMKDIWAFPSRAIAVAESPTLGVKALEWTDAEARWRYIDDGTQNDSGLGRFVGKLWMPNENEVYYGVSPGYIYHGTRTAEQTWSWTRDRLANSSGVDLYDGNPEYWRREGASPTPSLGVWGTSGDDVYAWFKDTIYHRTRVDGAPPEWIVEYEALDSDAPGREQLFFFGAAGTSADDVWFSGARSRNEAGCALLVRKHAGVYQRVADGTVEDYAPCAARRGTELIGGAEGWLTDIQTLGPGDFVALKGARDVVRIKVEGEAYSVTATPVPTTVSTKELNSLTALAGNLWLGGAGLVVRGTSASGDGAFELSPIWPNGTPITTAIWQVRGASNTNLWAIGLRNALHKTTP
ncbi:hypothetical protein AKJ09_06766 [Labilithrix luteola]|uniref:Type IV fimbrial biogenesis protein PilY1 n=1 Tax=Labilithrix luteola TaxID=1391654 RepID=A0A0K1Q312_9BACT|nr:hypothetical protein [Labilithrix luteola]AKV00103.1 hypothetical protein AKJ09_06766 [Labilithrix luteola]